MTSTIHGSRPTSPPTWPHCGFGSVSLGDPVGCRGVNLPGHGSCLAHLDDTDLTAYLASMSPDTILDYRGTTFTADLLQRLLRSLVDSNTNRPRLTHARFDEATFGDQTRFDGATFIGRTRFDGAAFGDNTWFYGATFSDRTRFDGTNFGKHVRFDGATFNGRTRFDGAAFGDNTWFYGAKFGDNTVFDRTTFGDRAVFDRVEFGNNTGFYETTFGSNSRFDTTIFGNNTRFDKATFGSNIRFYRAAFGDSAWFDRATFSDSAVFDGSTFGKNARFDEVQFVGEIRLGNVSFYGNAQFNRAVFERTSVVGPLACTGDLDLSEAVFGSAVTMKAAAKAMLCRRTRWASTAALRLRHVSVDLSDAVMEYPVSVAPHNGSFMGGTGAERTEPDLDSTPVRVVSLRGADAAHLILTDVDLTACSFVGTIHLDQLRMEGRCPLPTAPLGLHWHWGLPVRWTPRHTLAEEQHWRATHPRAGGWIPALSGEEVLEPAALAPIYRQLRKALEDGKNEPGAADFYYGEMEMRRHDSHSPLGERALLALYWAFSGYGLRASRAIGWLLACMVATVAVMMLSGLPQDSPKPTTSGRQVEAGHTLTLVTDTPDPVNPTGPFAERLTTERFEKGLQVTVNSAVFRSSDQALTTIGTYTEMVIRFIAPLFLGLAVLAIRCRVKR